MVVAVNAINQIKIDKKEKEFYLDYGFLLVPNLINPSLISELKENVIEAVYQAHGEKRGKLMQTHEYLENSALDSLINDPALKSIVEYLQDGPSTVYLPFSAVKSSNGGGDFHFHQDNQYTRFDDLGLNCWFALSDMSPENGCLCVIPKSHKEGTVDSSESPDQDGHRMTNTNCDDYLPVRMRAGDCIIFDRNTVHGSGKNFTDQDRIAYAVQFFKNGAKGLKRQTNTWHDLIKEPIYDIKPLTVFTNKSAGY